MLLLEILYSFLVLIGSLSFLWYSIHSTGELSYKNTAVDICLIMFWFNMFHIHFYSENYPNIAKSINIFYIFIIACITLTGDVLLYINNTSIYKNIYICYIILDFIYLLTLTFLRLYDYRTTFISTKSDMVILLGFQYGWFVNLISQIIPIYSDRRMPLTNDFVFWSIFIAEEIYRHHMIDETKKQIMLDRQTDRSINDELDIDRDNNPSFQNLGKSSRASSSAVRSVTGGSECESRPSLTTRFFSITNSIIIDYKQFNYSTSYF